MRTEPTERARRSVRAGSEDGDIRARLGEAEDLLRALRCGEVDALVVSTPAGDQVFTLTGADRPYRRLIEAMTEGALTMARDGTILYANSRFAEMVKTPLEQVVGSPIRSHIAATSQPAFDAMFRLSLEGSGKAEVAFQASDGAVVPVHLSLGCLDVDTQAVYAVATDLTTLKRDEEIVAAGRLANAILEQAADAIIVCDDRGVVIRASRAARELCPSSPLSRPFDEVLPLRVVPSGYAGANGNGSPFSLDEAIMRGTCRGLQVTLERDGRVRHMLLSVGTLSDCQVPLGCVIGLTDVTERVHLQSRLEAEQARMRALIDNVPEGIVVADRQGRVELTNPEADRVYGRPVPLSRDFASHAEMCLCYPDGSPYDPRDLPLTRSASMVTL